VTAEIENLQALVKPDYCLNESQQLCDAREGQQRAGVISGVIRSCHVSTDHGTAFTTTQ
jgi:hypothetical protein